MSVLLPNEIEELLDVLRRRILDRELREIALLMEEGIHGEDLLAMQTLQKRILEAYHCEGGYIVRQKLCEEIAKVSLGVA